MRKALIALVAGTMMLAGCPGSKDSDEYSRTFTLGGR